MLLAAEVVYNFTINYTGYKARLISADEIAKITGIDIQLYWSSNKTYSLPITDINNQSSYFYFDGVGNSYDRCQTQISNYQGASNYAWLFDYTSDCNGLGCNKEDSNV